MLPKFLQIHLLTSFPASLINRDDAGLAKRIPFGSATRTRISSQCLKSHWRRHEGKYALSSIEGSSMSVRSRGVFAELILARLVSNGVEASLAAAVTEAFFKAVIKRADKGAMDAPKAPETEDEEVEGPAKKAAKKTPEACMTSQVTVLGRPEIEFLVQEAQALATKLKGKDLSKVPDAFAAHFTKEKKANLQGLQQGAGLDAVMFGRMITSDILARTDAAIHVAHSFTVHAEQTESDYFTTIDDLDRLHGKTESAHIGNVELTTGLYYTYVVVDVPQLISNLTGVDRKDWKAHQSQLSQDVIRNLVHLVATVSPAAKKGSTAPHAYASLVLIEKGSEQPRTLADAFLEPVDLKGNVQVNAIGRLARHLVDLDKNYPGELERQAMILGGSAQLDSLLTSKPMSLPELASWAGKKA